MVGIYTIFQASQTHAAFGMKEKWDAETTGSPMFSRRIYYAVRGAT